LGIQGAASLTWEKKDTAGRKTQIGGHRFVSALTEVDLGATSYV